MSRLFIEKAQRFLQKNILPDIEKVLEKEGYIHQFPIQTKPKQLNVEGVYAD